MVPFGVHRCLLQMTLLPQALKGQRVVPELALQYVMFHEMLHLRHPVEHNGARRRVHTREFRAAEKKFARLKEAKEMLKKL